MHPPLRIPQPADAAKTNEQRRRRDVALTTRKGATKVWSSHEKWTFGVEVVGFCAVLASVLFLWQQTSQLNQTLDKSITDGIFERTLQWDELLIEHADALPYLYLQSEPPPGADPGLLRKAEALAAYQIDFLDYIVAMRPYIDDESLEIEVVTEPGSDWQSWSTTIVNTFQESRLMCSTLVESSAQYSDDFISMLREAGACPGL